jgi:hypothetical protein
MKPIPAKPRIIMAQVEGSGTAETSNVRDPVLQKKIKNILTNQDSLS